MVFSSIYDVIVIGAGHAGCEAALASARMGCATLLLTLNMDNIALMPCNPSIGGPAKGHLVREIDALGGEMAIVADAASIQMRLLNTSKGPAVHALRGQEDKLLYQSEMRRALAMVSTLEVRQLMVEELVFEQRSIKGIITEDGEKIGCESLILATGTYLCGRIVLGNVSYTAGPNGQRAANKLSQSMSNAGIRLRRFKTGTPARIDSRSVDFSKMTIQPGDEKTHNFSYLSTIKERQQQPCWLSYTSSATHQLIRENLHRAPLYNGNIEGTGPRYCPSIEVKIVNFPDKSSHQVFIEPEGVSTNEMYIQGMSTSLPTDVQLSMLQTIPGLESVRIMRYGYAIEYDCIDPTQLNLSLAFKHLNGLFSAGQVNGSSGYEEAAAQGIVAGINAALYVKKKAPFVLSRSDAYIGVLIDDLVTKGTNEPYRLTTSRAEYRLLMRYDNADLRLTKLGYEVGLATLGRFNRTQHKLEQIESTVATLKSMIITPSESTQALFRELKTAQVKSGISCFDLLKRPEITYTLLQQELDLPLVGLEVHMQVEIMIKYEGYIKKQIEQVFRADKLESKVIPETINYEDISTISREARQKLSAIRPVTIGQASRISGVSPSDVTLLLIFIEQKIRRQSRESQ